MADVSTAARFRIPNFHQENRSRSCPRLGKEVVNYFEDSKKIKQSTNELTATGNAGAGYSAVFPKTARQSAIEKKLWRDDDPATAKKRAQRQRQRPSL